MLIEGKTPWEFAIDWYRVDDIHHCINGKDELGRLRTDIPEDIRSLKFAEWLAYQYRLAMNKGTDLAERQLAAELQQAQARVRELEGEAAAMREALELCNGRRECGEFWQDWTNRDGSKTDFCKKVEAALSGSAGVEVLKEVERLREALTGMVALHSHMGPLFVVDFGPGGTTEEFKAQETIDAALVKARAALSQGPKP